jgi:hypothetical protein
LSLSLLLLLLLFLLLMVMHGTTLAAYCRPGLRPLTRT